MRCERWSPTAFCDYDPVKKKADIGSNFLNGRETSRTGTGGDSDEFRAAIIG